MYTHTLSVEDRCRRLGLSMASVARRAGVRYVRLLRNELDMLEVAAVEDALSAIEGGRGGLGQAAVLSRDDDGTVRLDGIPVRDIAIEESK